MRTLRACPPPHFDELLSPVAAVGCIPAAATGSPPAPPNASYTQAHLDRLMIAPAGTLAGYSRDRFGGGWSTMTNGCDVRDRVLIRDGRGVQPGVGCKITTGRWRSVYDGPPSARG